MTKLAAGPAIGPCGLPSHPGGSHVTIDVMRLFVCLLGIAVAGAALSLVPHLYLPFVPVPSRGWAGDSWVRCVGLFAIPLSLALLGLSRSALVRWLDIGWGVWMGSLSIAVLWTARSPFSAFYSWRATLFVLGVLVLSVGTTLFAAMALSRPKP